MLTTFDTAPEIEGALRAGAAGYLLKDAEPARIVAAVLAAAAGEPVLSPQVARHLMDAAARAGGERERARAALGAAHPARAGRRAAPSAVAAATPAWPARCS